jgi:hypothetical protein
MADWSCGPGGRVAESNTCISQHELNIALAKTRSVIFYSDGIDPLIESHGTNSVHIVHGVQ